MDVLKFLSSRDMREHLKKINYKFSALEAAWLVWHSEFIWDEKKKAFLEIMNEFEDMHIERETRNVTLNGSLFEYIKKYINWFEKQISLVKDKEDNSFYSYRVYNDKGVGRLCGGYLFSTYEKLMNYLRGLDCEVQQIAHFLVKKEYLDEKITHTSNTIYFYLDRSFNVLDVSSHQGEDEQIGNNFFGSFWLDIPHPFKKGDILHSSRTSFTCSEKIVVSSINDISEEAKKSAVSLDMKVIGYSLDFSDIIRKNELSYYMDFEKCNGRIEDESDELLEAVSKSLKEKISIGEILDAQLQALTGRLHNDMKLRMQWIDEFYNEIYGIRKIKD